MKHANGWSVGLSALVIGAGMLLASVAASAASLDSDATAALNALYKKYPSAIALSKSAKAIVVFPSITKAGLGIGGETGNGVMRVNGKSVGYYNNSGISSGLQIGAQKYGYALFLMTDKAVDAFGSAQGFEVGVGPSVVLMDEASAAKKTSTTTAQSDIYAFIFSQKGLMAGMGIQGNKVTKIDKPK
jgi:lipid-binding SYLF domain-containing protein